MTGRLRTRWVGIHTDEVFFRDTAHGFPGLVRLDPAGRGAARLDRLRHSVDQRAGRRHRRLRAAQGATAAAFDLGAGRSEPAISSTSCFGRRPAARRRRRIVPMRGRKSPASW